MSDKVMVQPINTYEDHNEGWKHPGSAPYSVDPSRAAQLRANGLVRDAETKIASPAPNKMAAVPANKGSSK